MSNTATLRRFVSRKRGARSLRMLACVALCTVSLVGATEAARAQVGDQRQAAAEAYDRGTAAYLADDYARAARWFETAHRLAPAAPALIQAVRAHHKADNMPRALTLAFQLEREYPSDERATTLARELLDAHSRSFTRVEVVCDGCKVDLDGKLQDVTTLFLEPDTQHEISGVFATGRTTQQISGSAAETITITFRAPPPAPEPTPTPEVLPTDIEGPPPIRAEGWKASPAVTYVGIVLTAGLTAATIVSGVDARSKGDSFDGVLRQARGIGCNTSTPPDQARCADLKAQAEAQLGPAQDAETRTNILLLSTGVVALGTAVVAIWLTDWAGDRDTQQAHRGRDLRFAVARRGDGMFAAVEGTF